jgi:hypothetical protein
MKLFANGCSFTWGAEIVENEIKEPVNPYDPTDLVTKKFREERVWAHLLNDRIKSESLSNIASGGASNRRILRTTLDYFNDLLNHGQNVDDYIAVIQWTEPNRTEIYNELIDDYINVGVDRVFYRSNKIVSDKVDVKPIISQYKTFQKERYMLHDKNFIDETNACVLALSGFFEKHSVRYLFCKMNADKIYDNQINWLGTSINELLLFNGGKNTHWYKNRYFYPHFHPNLLGHELIAESLYKRLQELYNL